VRFGFLVADGHLVEGALGGAVWSGLVIGSVQYVIDGMVVCALHDGTVICALNEALCLFFILLLEVDCVDKLGTVEVRAVAGDII